MMSTEAGARLAAWRWLPVLGLAWCGHAQTPVPPAIQAAPQTIAVMPGGSGAMIVVAGGSPAPTYQWRFNGVPIAAATGATLRLRNFGPSQVGRYTVTVLNAAGSVESGAWALLGSSFALKPWAGRLNVPGSLDGKGDEARFARPTGLAADAAGNIYVSDTAACTIRKITPDGAVTTLAGRAGVPGTADGPPDVARFSFPPRLALDTANNLYVVDAQGTALRKIAPDGTTTTIARFRLGFGIGCLTFDPDNNAFIASDNLIQKMTPGGTFTDVVGRAADLHGVSAIVIDHDRNLFALDGANFTIRKITPSGQVTTLAGTAGYYGFKDGVGADAQFNLYDAGMAIDEDGVLYVGDSFNQALRRVTPAGVVTTVARWSGFFAGSVAIDPIGNVYLAAETAYAVLKGAVIGPPLVTANPVSQRIAAGNAVSFSVGAVGVPAPAFQWQSSADGRTWMNITDAAGYAGATTATLSVMDVNVAMDGRRFRCVVANDVDPGAVSEAATLAVDGSQLTNLSSRSFVGSGDGIQIAGFVVAGVGSKPILIRSAGPALSTRFQLSGALMNPTLSLYGGPTVLATNSGWSRSPNSAAIAVTSVAVGAFPWEVGSNDSAILATLPPGGFTAQISGLADAAGTALVEVYDADPAAPGRLVNLSTRARVKAGDDILIAGFVIAGNQPKRVLVRASGPALKANFGLADVLADPELTLFQGSARLDSNTGWSSAPNASAIETVATSLGAFPTPSASKDSALLSTLPPGAYTAQVRSLSGNSGLVIVEVYDADRR